MSHMFGCAQDCAHFWQLSVSAHLPVFFHTSPTRVAAGSVKPGLMNAGVSFFLRKPSTQKYALVLHLHQMQCLPFPVLHQLQSLGHTGRPNRPSCATVLCALLIAARRSGVYRAAVRVRAGHQVNHWMSDRTTQELEYPRQHKSQTSRQHSRRSRKSSQSLRQE